MKKILLPLFSIAIITCSSCVVITSCKSKPTPAPNPSEPDICTFAVKWRTEDLQWSVGHELPKDNQGTPREWVWIDHPGIDCKFEVADGYKLPDGIQLSSDGHLSGTPTSPFMEYVKFKAVSDNYAPNLSPAIRFIINQAGSEPTPVSWTGDMWFQHVVSLSADTKIYLGEASALAANGEFALRQGYELPDGLSLSSDGILSGMPTEIGNYEISFEYRAKENATFETNYSPKYHINICYKHEITITINHNNGQWVSNNLTLSLLSLDNEPINSFDRLTGWLHDNKSWEPTAYPAIGDMTNKHNADVWKIVGIALPTPQQMDKIKFYFNPTANPGFQMELSKDDFASIADTII